MFCAEVVDEFSGVRSGAVEILVLLGYCVLSQFVGQLFKTV